MQKVVVFSHSITSGCWASQASPSKKKHRDPSAPASQVLSLTSDQHAWLNCLNITNRPMKLSSVIKETMLKELDLVGAKSLRDS